MPSRSNALVSLRERPAPTCGLPEDGIGLSTVVVDIFVPFWGDPALLYETVASVRRQSDPRWRLTVIDDAYPDDTVAERFAQIEDDRIFYVRHETNQGIVAGFQESVDRATHPRVVVLGCDDVLHPNYVALITRIASAHPSADIIQPGVEVIDQHGRPARTLVDLVKQQVLAPPVKEGPVILEGEQLATSLIRGDWLYWPSLALRTDFVQRIGFRNDLPIILDLALLMDMAFAGARLLYTPETAFSYRRHRGSASQTSLLDGRRFDDERRYYGEVHARARAIGWNRTAGAAALRLFSRLHAVAEAPHVLRHGNRAGIAAVARHIFA